MPLPSGHESAEQGHLGVVESLLDENPELLEAKDEDGWKLLQLAVFISRLEVVCPKGANVDGRDERVWTPLQEAAYNSIIEMLRVLVEGGANVTTRVGCGRTPLHFAAMDGFPDMVAFLPENGADVGLRDELGKTALDWAQELSNETVVALLQDRQT